MRPMSSGTNIIDAALRFARSNPELVACARDGALDSGRSVDDLLLDAVARLRSTVEDREIVELRPYQPRLYRRSSVAPSRRTESSS